jgi:hypothetical protein
VPPIVIPYTQNFDRKSGVKSPRKIPKKLTLPFIFFGRCACTA